MSVTLADDTPPTQAPQISASGRRREDAHQLEIERQYRAIGEFIRSSLNRLPVGVVYERLRQYAEDETRLSAQLDQVRERRGRGR